MIDDANPDYESQEDTNMDWKKRGFDKHERLTLRVNMEEAIRRKANKKIHPFAAKKTKPFKKSSKKLKNKIKTSIYDDDEDEEDYILTPVFNNLQRFSLEQLLTPKEKKQLEKMEKEQNITPPEKLQIQQIVDEHIKEREKNIPQKNVKKAEALQEIKEHTAKKDTIESILIEKSEKPQEENKNEPKIFDNKETTKDISIEELLDDKNQQDDQENMRSLILEKSGRAKSKQHKNEKDHREQNTAELDLKNIKEAKDHER